MRKYGKNRTKKSKKTRQNKTKLFKYTLKGGFEMWQYNYKIDINYQNLFIENFKNNINKSYNNYIKNENIEKIDIEAFKNTNEYQDIINTLNLLINNEKDEYTKQRYDDFKSFIISDNFIKSLFYIDIAISLINKNDINMLNEIMECLRLYNNSKIIFETTIESVIEKIIDSHNNTTDIFNNTLFHTDCINILIRSKSYESYNNFIKCADEKIKNQRGEKIMFNLNDKTNKDNLIMQTKTLLDNDDDIKNVLIDNLIDKNKQNFSFNYQILLLEKIKNSEIIKPYIEKYENIDDILNHLVSEKQIHNLDYTIYNGSIEKYLNDETINFTKKNFIHDIILKNRIGNSNIKDIIKKNMKNPHSKTKIENLFGNDITTKISNNNINLKDVLRYKIQYELYEPYFEQKIEDITIQFMDNNNFNIQTYIPELIEFNKSANLEEIYKILIETIIINLVNRTNVNYNISKQNFIKLIRQLMVMDGIKNIKWVNFFCELLGKNPNIKKLYKCDKDKNGNFNIYTEKSLKDDVYTAFSYAFKKPPLTNPSK